MSAAFPLMSQRLTCSVSQRQFSFFIMHANTRRESRRVACHFHLYNLTFADNRSVFIFHYGIQELTPTFPEICYCTTLRALSGWAMADALFNVVPTI